MSKTTKADLIAALTAAGTDLSPSALKRKTVSELEGLLAELSCGGCENDDHCGDCECCEEAENSPETADEAAQATFSADPLPEAERPALATYEARGNYNTVWVPLAAALAEGTDADVWTEKVSTMLVNVHMDGAEAKELLDLLVDTVNDSLAALKVWMKTLDRKDQTDMERYNQNRSFLAGYGAAVARQLTGAKKMPVVPFAKDMDKALRPEALKAGATAARQDG